MLSASESSNIFKDEGGRNLGLYVLQDVLQDPCSWIILSMPQACCACHLTVGDPKLK